jgi:hypothetical protein
MKTSVNRTLATYNPCCTRNKVKFHRIRSVHFEYILVYMTLYPRELCHHVFQIGVEKSIFPFSDKYHKWTCPSACF